MANRMFRRERFDWRVKVLLPNGGRIDTVYGRTHDISYGGMGVVVTRTIKQDTPVLVIFKLPQIDAEIRLPAFVSHGSGFRCGLKFAKLSPEQKLLVQRICRALAA
jgi:hypothetical protein